MKPRNPGFRSILFIAGTSLLSASLVQAIGITVSDLTPNGDSGSGTLAFGDSSAVDWTGGTLNITGTFTSGASLRFGNDANGLSSSQLAAITVAGGGSYTLNGSGYLVESAVSGYSAWQAANSTTGALDLDHDGDGVSNGVEYFLGGDTNTTGFTALPGVDHNAGTLSVTWTKATTGYAGTYGSGFVVETSSSLAPGSWVTVVEGTGADEVEITGNHVKYTLPAGTKKFARLKVTGP